MTDGVYRFDNLLTQTRDEYDNVIVYAYRVRATDPAFKRNAYMMLSTCAAMTSHLIPTSG